MKSVLLGNGINIQFGGKAYCNDFIMRRIIFNAKAERYTPLFGGQIAGKEIEHIFREFINIANAAREGKYDGMGNADDEEAIADFKSRYKTPINKYYEIMLEDWFFLIRLFFLLNADIENQWQTAKQGFEHMILDAIYNEGMLNDIYPKMNKKVKRYFASFDQIFSLNYDCNLEALTGKTVLHLHGDYSVPADSENPETVQGYLRQQESQCVVIEDFRHCFCNALLDYSGELKFRRATAIMNGAAEINRWFTLAKENKAEYEKQAARLQAEDKYAYQLLSTYIANPHLKFGTDYHFERLRKLEGELHIIGLSPNNDSHIFRCINESNLDKVWFYCFSEADANINISKPYEIMSVKELWKSLGAENKTYNCAYPIPNHPDVDKFIDVFNSLSLDPIPKDKIITEINSLPQFEVNRLCEIMKKELVEKKNHGNPKSEKEFMQGLAEISRIGLKEGVLPSALFMLYIMNIKN